MSLITLKVWILSFMVTSCLAVDSSYNKKRGIITDSHGQSVNSLNSAPKNQLEYQIQFLRPPQSNKLGGKQVKVIVNPPVYYQPKVPQQPSMKYGGWYPMKDPSTEGWIGLESAGSRYEGYAGSNYPHSSGTPAQSSTNNEYNQNQGPSYDNHQLQNYYKQAQSFGQDHGSSAGTESPYGVLENSAYGNIVNYPEELKQQAQSQTDNSQQDYQGNDQPYAEAFTGAQGQVPNQFDDASKLQDYSPQNQGNTDAYNVGSQEQINHQENTGSYGTAPQGQVPSTDLQDINVSKLLASTLANIEGNSASWDQSGGYGINPSPNHGSNQETAQAQPQSPEEPKYVVKSLESILLESGGGLNQNSGHFGFGKNFGSPALSHPGLFGGHFGGSNLGYNTPPNPIPNGNGIKQSAAGPGGYGFVRDDSGSKPGGASSYSSVNVGPLFNSGRSKLAPSSPYNSPNSHRGSYRLGGPPRSHQSIKLAPVHAGKNIEYPSFHGRPNIEYPSLGGRGNPNIELPYKSSFARSIPNHGNVRYTKPEVGPWAKH